MSNLKRNLSFSFRGLKLSDLCRETVLIEKGFHLRRETTRQLSLILQENSQSSSSELEAACVGVTDEAGSGCFCYVSVEKTQAPGLFENNTVVAGGEQQLKVVYYRALYPFDARSHDEISIVPGDLIMVRNFAFTLTAAGGGVQQNEASFIEHLQKSRGSQRLQNRTLCQEKVGLFL